MSTQLQIDITKAGDQAQFNLKGKIDEDADFSELVKVQAKEMKFNLGQVTLINSCGIREWINYLEKIAGKTKIIYQQCPQVIIDQINMVKGFVPQGAIIESFFAPYFCDACDKEQSVMIKSSEMKGFHAPEMKCQTCEGTMEFDALEQQYFLFLKQK